MTKWESTFKSTNYRKLVTKALNRYLAILGARIEGGQLKGPEVKDRRIIVRKSKDAFPMPLPTFRSFEKSLEDLESPAWFAKNGGTGVLELDPPLSITLTDSEERTYEVVFEAIHIIAPWLRPKFMANVTLPYHELSKAYARLGAGAVFTSVWADQTKVADIGGRMCEACSWRRSRHGCLSATGSSGTRHALRPGGHRPSSRPAH